MQAFYMTLVFLARGYLLALLFTGLSVRFNGGPCTGSYILEFLLASSVTFSILCFDGIVLYPRLRSPLRKLPIVPYGIHGRMVAEKPRGKTPLSWTKKHPDAQMFNSRGRFGESVLYPVGPAALKDVFSTKAYDFVKPFGLRAYLVRIFGRGLITSEGAHHKVQRRNILPSFTIKRVRALYPMMWQKAGLLVGCMTNEMKSQSKVDVTPMASRYALDVIGRGAMSHEFDALGRRSHHPIAQSFAKLLDPDSLLMNFLMTSLIAPPWLAKWFHPKGVEAMERERDIIMREAEKLYNEERARPSDLKEDDGNILGSMIRNSSLDREEVIHNILTFFGAGHETSAASITWSLHLLSLPENQHYQRSLREEVRKLFPPMPTGEDWNLSAAELQPLLESSPWLNAICEEVLRLYPTVPATLRESTCQTMVDGCIVPKDSLLVVMPWVINRHPRYWGANAEEFRPERWIDKLEDGRLRANKHGGAPSNFCEATFLHGPRACVGRDFAKAETKCALAALFGRFLIERLPGDDGKARVSGQVTIKPQGGLRVKATALDGW